jgi:SAM-dependent methyltransferase
MKMFRRTPTPPMTLEPEIPPHEINYNHGALADPVAYAREFKERACLRELPFLMRHGLTPSSALLDYGCGLGRLAYAASKYLGEDGGYYGYEPNPTALAFLKNAYAPRRNFHFDGRPLRLEEDYVAIELKQPRVSGAVAGDIDLSSLVDRPIDVQWTCSVFTHMWIDPIVTVLRSVNRVMAPDGVCVNTWLCVDDFAAYSMRCGLSDRQLPIRINGALTYSEHNPLVCVAYELPTVQEIYRRAGHKILDILWGSWSGRDNGVIFIDIIVSKPER